MLLSVRSFALSASLALAGCAGASDAGRAEHPESSSEAGQGSGSKAEGKRSKGAGQATSENLSTLVARYGKEPAQKTYRGKASYYADSLAGNSTASGEPYDPERRSGAHRKLPFGTVVRVVRADTGAATYVVINDRGPFGPKDRIIDLSRAAASDLDMLGAGVVPVRVEVVARGAKSR